MKKSACILENAIKNNDYDKIKECLLIIQEKTIGKYSFVFKTEEEKEVFLNESYKVLYKEYEQLKHDRSEKNVNNLFFEPYYKKNILSKLREFISCYSEEEIYNITNRFINSQLNNYNISEEESCINLLERIDILYLMLKIVPSYSLLDKIFHNEIVHEIVETLIKLSSDDGKIKHDKVYGISQGIVTSMLVELYCKENSIKIDANSFQDDVGVSNAESVCFSLDSVNMYLNELSKYPVLSQLEELLLFIEYRDGNADVRNKLVESNLRLVVSIVRGYVKSGVDFLDLVQYGNLGLYDAIEKYDPYSGYKFSSYATYWIRQSITRNVTLERSKIKFPYWLNEAFITYNNAFNKLKEDFGRDPELFELAEYLHWTLAKITDVVNAKTSVVSLEQNISDDSDSDSLGDYVASDVLLENEVVENIFQNQLTEKIFDVLEKVNLTDKEREVLLYRFGFKTGRVETLDYVASNYGLTRERIRQIESSALKKMRNSRYRRELAFYLDDSKKALKNLEDNREDVQRGIKEINSVQTSAKIKKKTVKVISEVASKSDLRNEKGISNNFKTIVSDNITSSNVMTSSEKEKFLSSFTSSFDSNRAMSNSSLTQVKKQDIDSSDEASMVGADIVEEQPVVGFYDLKEEKEIVSCTSALHNGTTEENQEPNGDSSVSKAVKRRRLSPKGMISLKETFSLVDDEILDKFISEMTEKQQKIIAKRGVIPLDDKERNVYNANIIPKIKRKIAKEVAKGNIDEEVLNVYSIEPDKSNKRRTKRFNNRAYVNNNYGATLFETFSMIDKSILDNIISTFPEEHQAIINKRETDRLSDSERITYFSTILKKVKRRLATEVALGNLSDEILEIYKIKPDVNTLKAIEKSNRQAEVLKSNRRRLSLRQTFSKIEDEVFDRLLLSLTPEQQEIVKKRESGDKLSKNENTIYFIIVRKVKREIVKEVCLGNLSKDILDEYNITTTETIMDQINGKKVSRTIEGLTLKQAFSKIDESLLDAMILELSEKQQAVVAKREAGIKFTTKERNLYFGGVIYNIKRKIAREVANGNISDEMLSEYNIEPYTSSRKTSKEKKYNLTIYERYSKIDADILDNIINNFPQKYKDIIHKQGISRLTSKEKATYNSTILPKIKALVAVEGGCGTIPLDVLSEYNIEPKVSDNLVVKIGDSRSTDCDCVLFDGKAENEISLELKEKLICDSTEVARERRTASYIAKGQSKVKNSKVPRAKKRIVDEVVVDDLSSIVPPSNKVEEKCDESTILKAKLLTVIANQETEQLDKMENIFYECFDSSYLTSDLNPKMFSYISMRFGYLDGNNYSKKAISRVLSDEDIRACNLNILLYVKYEISKFVDNVFDSEYQKVINNK